MALQGPRWQAHITTDKGCQRWLPLTRPNDHGRRYLVGGWRASRGHPSGSGPSPAGPTRASVHERADTPPLRATPVPSGTALREARPSAAAPEGEEGRPFQNGTRCLQTKHAAWRYPERTASRRAPGEDAPPGALAWRSSRSGAGRADRLLTPVDYCRHRLPSPLSLRRPANPASCT